MEITHVWYGDDDELLLVMSMTYVFVVIPWISWKDSMMTFSNMMMY